MRLSTFVTLIVVFLGGFIGIPKAASSLARNIASHSFVSDDYGLCSAVIQLAFSDEKKDLSSSSIIVGSGGYLGVCAQILNDRKGTIRLFGDTSLRQIDDVLRITDVLHSNPTTNAYAIQKVSEIVADSLITANPDLADAYCRKSDILVSRKEYLEAVSILNEGLRNARLFGTLCSSKDDLQIRLAEALIHSNAIDVAAEVLFELVDSSRYSEKAVLMIADICINRPDKSTECFDQAGFLLRSLLQNDPKNLSAFLKLAQMALIQGRDEQALKIYEDAVQAFDGRQSTNNNYRDSGLEPLYAVLIEYGRLLSHVGKYDEAISELQNAIELGPYDFRAQFWLSQVYINYQHYAEATDTLQQLLIDFPRSQELVQRELLRIQQLREGD